MSKFGDSRRLATCNVNHCLENIYTSFVTEEDFLIDKEWGLHRILGNAR